VTWADGLGEWEDGYNSGALRRAVDAGLVDMNELVQIWQSKPIPEGPVVLRKDLPADVKEKMTALWAGLHEKDRECFYGVAAGEAKAFEPITHEAYEIIIEARKRKSS
jgi:phosphonate transport system substrate-binding protein